ncbi:MAG TPA: helix-turn-helix transcriptional regulator [Streptosporangiaceae bacterium]
MTAVDGALGARLADLRNPGGAVPARIVDDSARLGWGNVHAELWLDDRAVAPFEAPAYDHPSVVLVLQGAALLETRQGNGWRKARFGPGSVGLNPAGLTRTLRWQASSPQQIETLHLFLSAGLVHDTVDAFGAAADRAFPDVFDLRAPDIAASAQALAWGLRQKAPAIYAESAAVVLISRVAAASVPTVAPATSRPLDASTMRLVIDYMYDNAGQDVTLDDLAAVAHLSKYHLVRAFKARTGSPPHAYLQRIRLSRASVLLRQTSASVAQIANESGYRSASQFTAAFRRHYGQSPARYRASHAIS